MSLDLTGQTFGQLYVLNRHSSLHKKVRWLCQCKACDKVYDIPTDVVKANTKGCSECAKANTARGKDSEYWQGGEYIPAVFISNVKRSAAKRNIPFNLTIAELDLIWSLQEGRCAYTNRQLSLDPSSSTASLDRIDSSKGYEATNVQFVHKSVNISKWTMSEEEFLQMIKEIYTNKVENCGNCFNTK